MKKYLCAVLLLVLLSPAFGTTWYVDDDRPDNSGDGLSWATAKRTIQAAVDAAAPYETIMVNPGNYAEGGRVEPGYILMNRVYIGKAITLRSSQGPTVTVITGGTGVRGVCIDHNEGVLDGFSVSGGRTLVGFGFDYVHELCGGGVFCNDAPNALVTNCYISANTATASGGGGVSGRYIDCDFVSNSAESSGAGTVFGARLLRCELVNNDAGNGYGGGAAECFLNDCLISANRAGHGGGGYGITATNCFIQNNEAINQNGGGADNSYLYRCRLINNIAEYNGGGAHNSRCHDCIIELNSAQEGGGTSEGVSRGCTISRNSAQYGGGTSSGQLYNSIIYGNSATLTHNNSYNSTLYNCCTPFIEYAYQDMGGNKTSNPLFESLSTGVYNLLSSSPCIDSGNFAYTETSEDFSRHPRRVFAQVDMGAYEYIEFEYDYDGDGLSNDDETTAGTDMTDPESRLAFIETVLSNGVLMTWIGGSNVNQRIEMKNDLASTNQFWTSIYTNLSPMLITNSYFHSAAQPPRPFSVIQID
jgi:hypothetical protein